MSLDLSGDGHYGRLRLAVSHSGTAWKAAMDVSQETCGARTRSMPSFFFLLTLWVLKASADCPKPQGLENIVLTYEALLMNDFPEGTIVILECANGYLLESGSGVITCTDDNWTHPDLQCKKKDCGPPRPQPHMSFNISAGTLFGDIIRVTCDKGYQISGSSYKQCYSTGWSGRSKCEIITCEKPPEVTNGRRSWDAHDDPKYGEEILYSCDVGHTLVGPDRIMCNEDGEYNSPPPLCSGVTTEDRITAPTSPVKEASNSAELSATATAYRDKYVTATTAPAFPPSGREVGKDILRPQSNSTSPSLEPTAPPSFQEKPTVDVKNNTNTDYTAVILSVIGVALVACIVVLFIHKYHLRRKGSYDTKEDRKPELLQFQNL
uniref:Complement receptor type 2-like n=2 Tax=Gouania willdenowi TaxID=441366 RepID=A0A8C5NCF1_GOUWI